MTTSDHIYLKSRNNLIKTAMDTEQIILHIENDDLGVSMEGYLGSVAKALITITSAELEVLPTLRQESITVEISLNKYLTGKSAYQIAVANGFTGTEEQWLDSLVGPLGMNQLTEGEKRSSRDAGNKWDMSLTDDYIYVCVKGGGPGQATWKRFILFAT